MEIEFENRNAFQVSGYSTETSEETLEKDCAMLREKSEENLKSVSNYLYFVAWMKKENVMIYHFGVEAQSQSPVTEGATCVEVPATRFAVATVPKDKPILDTWHKFFETFQKDIPILAGATIDLEYPVNFESFDDKGVCKLWIPIE